jgi:hypothetical protein
MSDDRSGKKSQGNSSQSRDGIKRDGGSQVTVAVT